MDQLTRQQRASCGGAFVAAAVVVSLALWPRSDDNLLGACGRVLARILSAGFGLGAWLLPVFLLTYARATVLGHRQSPRRLPMLLVLALACTTFHLVDAAGGRLGAMLGNPLLTLLGVGAYVGCAAVIVALLARWASLSVPRTIGSILSNSRRRLAAAWRAATALELKQHAQTLVRENVVTDRQQSVRGTMRLAHVASVSEEALTPADARVEVNTSRADVGWVDDSADLFVAEAAESVSPPTLARSGNASKLGLSSVDPGLKQPLQVGPNLLPYRLPTAALLASPASVARTVDERTLKATALKLEARLAGYGIEGRMDGLTPGPVVTMYEFEPRAGTKLSKIKGLEAELSMLLEKGVRIIAPLPGTARVGIEVPHPETERATVYLRELLEDECWERFKANLPLALGRDPSGQPVFCDLAAAPHLLVAGATGSGKSSGLSAMLTSLLLKKTPDELRLVLIDPKVVELSAFADIPHLLVPVVTETKEAEGALRWAVEEMERRYRLLAEVGARNIDAYNARVSLALPSIVIVVDEFADLMMVDKEKRVEGAIARLAQKARAAGIHLIIATQRPSVDVITGLIKANLPSRIAYRVAQWVDSKVILDRKGAEHLLGRGDMLCQLPGNLDLLRVHSAYVGDDEVTAVCDCLRAQRGPQYDPCIAAMLEGSADGPASETADPLYERAVGSVVAAGSCSTSALQRELNVGYNRAARLVESMERLGVVGPPARAGGKREVLIEA